MCGLLHIGRNFCGLGFFFEAQIRFSMLRFAGRLQVKLDQSSPARGADADIHVLCEALISAEGRSMS
jgi:hypothetical protein